MIQSEIENRYDHARTVEMDPKIQEGARKKHVHTQKERKRERGRHYANILKLNSIYIRIHIDVVKLEDSVKMRIA